MTSLAQHPELTDYAPARLRRARRSVFLTFAIAGVGMAAWVPRIPEIKSHLDLSAGTLGVALLGPALGALIAMTIVPTVATRLGTAAATRAFTALYLLLIWLPGLSQSFPELLGLLLLTGLGIGGMDVAMNSQAVSVEKAYGRPLMSGFHAAWSLGSLLGAAIGTAGAAGHVPIALQQAILCAVVAVVFVPVARGFLADPTQREPAPVAEDARVRRFDILSLRLVLLGLGGIAAMLAEGSVGDWSGILLRDSLHAGPGLVGLGFVAFMATQTSGRLLGDRFVLRVGRIKAIATVSLVGSVGLAAGMGTHTLVGTVIGFALLGIGVSITVPLSISAAADGHANAGPSIALVSSFSYTGFLIGPTAIGFFAQATSVPTALWLVPFIVAAGGGAVICAMRRPQ
jgi:MFS family permease